MIMENLVDCVGCGTTFDVVYPTPPGVDEVEDIVDPPSMLVKCPACDAEWEREWEGWSFHDEAG